MKYLVFFSVVLISSACSCNGWSPSGGGATHIPDPALPDNGDLIVKLEIETWTGGGKVPEIGEPFIFYRVNQTGPFKRVQMDEEWPGFVYSIDVDGINVVEYYFEYQIDGHTNQHGSQATPHTVERR
jgi:hypothetical protein